MKSLIADARRALVDADLTDVDGVTRWTETTRYGGRMDLMVNERHLSAVLRARADADWADFEGGARAETDEFADEPLTEPEPLSAEDVKVLGMMDEEAEFYENEAM